MMDMKEARKELKKLAKGKYYTVTYKFIENSSNETYQECSVYIDGYDYYTGSTWETAIDRIKRCVIPCVIKMENIKPMIKSN